MVEQYLVILCGCCLQVKVHVVKIALFVGKLFVHAQIFNYENYDIFAPRKLPAILYLAVSKTYLSFWYIIIIISSEKISGA